MEQAIGNLKQEMQEVLTENILSYWMRRMIDEEYGGFYGRITGMDELTPEAVKGLFLMLVFCGLSLLLIDCSLKKNT